jgi:hypothetical protein
MPEGSHHPEGPAVPQPQPLRAATQGFAELARWYTDLVCGQAVDVARAIDEGGFDAEAATAAMARTATFPLLGWVGLANEVLDAAAVFEHPPRPVRDLTSDVFVGLDTWTGEELKVRPLTNGFDEQLPESVTVRVEPSPLGQDRSFRLVATGVPARCFGVYQGQAAPEDASDAVDVWLVVP